MIDSNAIQIPLNKVHALIVSDSDWGLEELQGLLETMGGEVKERLKLPVLKKIHPGTYLGAGKLEEIRVILEAKNLDMVLFDFDLSPSQYKGIESVLKKLVLDRSGIILEIFYRHAKTKEAKLQVEIARLQYLMPRLTHMWSHFERQRGSGGGALKGKGMGEKQIEVDRRLVKDRLNLLKKKLKEVDSVRGTQRNSRESLLKVAMVGYTNAGKSTLLNALTDSDVLVEDALFATLDATVRLLNPKSRPAILGIDTVGFIDRLPHSLVASFRSTLSAVLEADLLIHVLDASHEEVKRHFEVTISVLKELKATEIPMLIVFNKMDRCQQKALVKVWGASLVREHNAEAVMYISALADQDVGQLREYILKFFEKRMQTYEVIIPYEDGRSVAKLYELGNVVAKRNTDKGTFFKVKTIPEFAHQMNLARFKI